MYKVICKEIDIRDGINNLEDELTTIFNKFPISDVVVFKQNFSKSGKAFVTIILKLTI